MASKNIYFLISADCVVSVGCDRWHVQRLADNYIYQSNETMGNWCLCTNKYGSERWWVWHTV